VVVVVEAEAGEETRNVMGEAVGAVAPLNALATTTMAAMTWMTTPRTILGRILMTWRTRLRRSWRLICLRRSTRN